MPAAARGVELIVSATGNPVELIRRVKDFGARIFCDAISLRFAEKAIGAGADGIVAIGAGGGGHSGVVSHLTLVPRIREMFDGTIVMAGAVTTGAAIRAAEVLGADLAYLGTRFIATQESGVPEGYKDLLISQRATDLIYTPALGGVDCMWMKESLRQNGLDPDDLPQPAGRMRYDHLPEGVRPWKTVWSAGQGIEMIRDIPTVAELVLAAAARIRRGLRGAEHRRCCAWLAQRPSKRGGRFSAKARVPPCGRRSPRNSPAPRPRGRAIRPACRSRRRAARA